MTKKSKKTEVKEVYLQEQSVPLEVEKPIEEKKKEEKPAVLSL